MTHTTTGFYTMPDGSIYYEVAGEGETLVLLHAGFLDSRMFDPQWDALSGHFRLIRFDMRGYGQSSDATGPLCRRDDLRGLLSHLGVTSAHVVGCSMGGSIALDFTLQHPALVSSLTLVDATPGGFELQGEPPRHIPEMFAAMQAGDIGKASELQIRIWLDGPREPDQVGPALRAKALAMNRPSIERRTLFLADMQPLRPLEPPAVSRREEVICPALCVVGALDHPEIHRATVEMAARIPNARTLTIAGSAHVPSFESPTEFNAALLDFLCLK